MSSPNGGRVQLWQHARLLLAPLLAIVLLTIGCGTSPRPAPLTNPPSRHIQAVSDYHVGVGLNMATNEYFMFSDFEAARQQPEASTSFLVALSGYQLWGPQASTGGMIDAMVAVPGGGQAPISAGIDLFHWGHDWYAGLAATDRDISGETFSTIAARAASLELTPDMAPRMAVDAATRGATAGGYTVGSVWGDVRLMLAALARWSSIQPASAWGGGGGGSGGGAQPTPVLNATGYIAVAWNHTDNWIYSLNFPYPSGARPDNIIVSLTSVEFASGSSAPSRVTFRKEYRDLRIESETIDVTGRLVATDWTPLLGSPSPVGLDLTTVEAMGAAARAKQAALPYSSFLDLFEEARSGRAPDARTEASALLVAALALAMPGLHVQELDNLSPLQAGEIVPFATIAVGTNAISGERVLVTTPQVLQDLRANPTYTVASLAGVGLSDTGKVRWLRIRLDYDGMAQTFKVAFPGDHTWEDPGLNYAISDEDWQLIVSGEFNTQQSPWRVQNQLAVVGIVAAILVGLMVFDAEIAKRVRRIYTPCSDEAPPQIPVDEYPELSVLMKVKEEIASKLPSPATPPPCPSPSPSPTPAPSPTPTPSPPPNGIRVSVTREWCYISCSSFPAGTFDKGYLTLGEGESLGLLPIEGSLFSWFVKFTGNGPVHPFGGGEPVTSFNVQ